MSAATLTVTANNRSKSYGQALTLGTTSFTTSSLVNGDTVTGVTLTSTGAAPTATVAGSPYTIVPSAAQGTGLGNYTITYKPSSLTMSAATLTITANADSKTYGQTKTFGAGSTAFGSTGLQNGESIGSVTIAASGGTAANAAVGSYSLTPSAATGGTFTASNYSITYTPGTLTVTAAPLTVTANNRSKSYGQALTLGTTAFTISGLVNDDTVTGVTLTSTGRHRRLQSPARPTVSCPAPPRAGLSRPRTTRSPTPRAR